MRDTGNRRRTGAIIKYTLAVGALVLLPMGVAFAVTGTAYGIGAIASQVTGTLSYIAKLITAAGFVAGFAFAIAAIFKFKQHKDNPTQIPVGTPIALLFIGAALIFLPSLFATLGATLFGTATAGSATGTATIGKA